MGKQADILKSFKAAQFSFWQADVSETCKETLSNKPESIVKTLEIGAAKVWRSRETSGPKNKSNAQFDENCPWRKWKRSN